jgi:hypothetical protein
MITVKHAEKCSFLPTISTKNNLLSIPIQQNQKFCSGESKVINFGYKICLDKNWLIDFFVCGELQTKGIILKRQRYIHTADSNNKILTIELINTSRNSILINAGDHILHGLLLTTKPQTLEYERF